MAGDNPFGEGMPDLQALLQQASSMQEQLLAAQHDLEGARVEGTSGGGLVHATVTGTGALIGLTLDPSVCDPDDPETLADLVLAAVHNAVDTAREQANETMGGITGGLGGLGGDLPGDLGIQLGVGGGGSPAGLAIPHQPAPPDDDA